MRRSLLGLLVVSLLALTSCGTSAPTAQPAPATSAPASGGSQSGCATVPAPAPKDSAVAEPSGSLSPDKTYVVRLNTSCGEIDIRLDQAKNPKTANSFAHLTREKYYDETTFHRVVPGFVIQGGDPAGDGTGGPSWKVVEAPAQDTAYVKGVVAMAKAGSEAPGTSGSQFFIVTGSDVGLPPEYAVAGRVTKGMQVADLIAAQGQEGGDGPPKQPVVITSATLIES